MPERIWGKSWRQISEDLRDLQGTVSMYKGRFEAAGYEEIALELGDCILKLMSAEGIAMTIHLKDRGLG